MGNIKSILDIECTAVKYVARAGSVEGGGNSGILECMMEQARTWSDVVAAGSSKTAMDSFVRSESSEGNTVEYITVAGMSNLHRDDERDSLDSGPSDLWFCILEAALSADDTASIYTKKEIATNKDGLDNDGMHRSDASPDNIVQRDKGS